MIYTNAVCVNNLNSSFKSYVLLEYYIKFYNYIIYCSTTNQSLLDYLINLKSQLSLVHYLYVWFKHPLKSVIGNVKKLFYFILLM